MVHLALGPSKCDLFFQMSLSTKDFAGPAFDSVPKALRPRCLEILLNLNLWALLAFYLKDRYVHCALSEMAQVLL